MKYSNFLLKVVVFALMLGASVCVCAQESSQPYGLETLARNLAVAGRSVPQEVVFVHMDNTGYYVGDTIYYKAYVRLSTGQLSNLSGLLYVELFDNDGYLVERQNIKLTDGQGHGCFLLTDSLYAGFYELRAYTRWQLNWGRTEHPHTQKVTKWFYNHQMRDDFYRDYEKLYSRVFPVYDKPAVAGRYTQGMTMRPMRRYFKRENLENSADVTFYPEGGHLLAGAKCRVAFDAVDGEGRNLSGTLSVLNSAGEKVAEAQTVSRGRGMFELVPKAGEKYRTVFTCGNGLTASGNLPEVEADGCAMMVKTLPNSISMNITRCGKAATQELAYTVMCNGVCKIYRSMGAENGNQMLLDTSKLPDGVADITVFDADGRIWADRLVFVRHDGFKGENIDVAGLNSDGIDACQKVALDLSAEKAGTVSVAVRDEASEANSFDTGNILTEMLLSSQIKGFVEQPDYYFEKNDDEHNTALDLLLMVQGWRRYDWKEMSIPGAFVRTEPIEKTQWIQGEVCKLPEPDDMRVYEPIPKSPADSLLIEEADALIKKHFNMNQANGMANLDSVQIKRREYITYLQMVMDRTRTTAANLKHSVTVHADFVLDHAIKDNGERSAQGDVLTSDRGDFRIEAPDYQGYCRFFCAASDQTKWKEGQKHEWIDDAEYKFDADGEGGMINYPEFYVRLREPYPRFVKPYSFYQTAEPEMSLHTNAGILSSDKVRTLDEVVIGARHGGMRRFDASTPALVVDAQEAFNQAVDAGMCPGYYNGAVSFINNVARVYVGDMNMDRNYDLQARFNGRNMSSNITAYDLSHYEHLHFLDKVYVYTDYSPRREGDKHYQQSNQPFVTVDLHRNMSGKQYKTYRDREKVLWGYAVCSDFYSPDYSKRTAPVTNDYRRTLYWNPDVRLDENGKAQISFFGNSHRSNVEVSVNGLATDGTPLTGFKRQ